MIMVIASFPTINTEYDKDFVKCFEWLNYLLKKTPGLISRRLLLGKNRTYIPVAEFDSMNSFIASTKVEHKIIHEKAASIFIGNLIREIYDVIDTDMKISVYVLKNNRIYES